MDKIARANTAQRILEDDVFKEAVANVRAEIVAEMVNPAIGDDECLDNRRMLAALSKIETRLKSMIATGRIEEKRRDRGNDR